MDRSTFDRVFIYSHTPNSYASSIKMPSARSSMLSIAASFELARYRSWRVQLGNGMRWITFQLITASPCLVAEPDIDIPLRPG